MATAKVLSDSALCYDSALDLWTSPPYNTGLSDVRYIEYTPVASYNSESSIRFLINNSGSQYLYFPDTKLKVTLRVLKHDGTTVPGMPAAPKEEGEKLSDADKLLSDWASVSTSNNLLHTLFDTVEVKFGNTIVTKNDSGYCYRAMFNTLLDTSSAVKRSRLQSALYFEDTPGAMDSLSTDYDTGSNRGLVARGQYVAESRPVELIGALDVDVLKTPKYILNGVPVSINLFATSTPFRLMSGNPHPGGYSIEIMSISLLVCTVTPANSVLLAHQQILQSNKPARYSYIQEELRKISIGAGNTSFFCDNLFNSSVPDRLVLALCTGRQVHGSYSLNPYHYRSCHLSYLAVSINGNLAPQGILKMHYDNPSANVVPFEDLYTVAPRVAGDDKHFGNQLTRDHFQNGYTIYSLDLNPSTRRGQFFPTKREGSVRLELRFSKPLPETMILLCMTYEGNYFEIDHARNVYLGR